MMDAFFRGGRPPVPKEKLDKSSKNERKNVPWVEKYRPKTIDDVAQQDEVVAVLKKTLEGADVPNMLFYGPPGTGKTSTILAACRDLFGVEMMKTRILELNASDERGINVIREKVKNFADGTANSKRSDGKSCPAFKIIILDEADSMTRPAQAALRRMMEKKTRTTRFCLICNYVSRIIEPITSRCAKFRFKPLEGVVLEDRLKHICERENVVCSPEALQMLMNVSEGDLRKAITLLQSARRLKGEDGVSESDISEIAGLIPQNMLDGLMQSCESDSYEKLSSCLKEIIAEGHSAYQLINQLHDMILFKSDVKDNQKSAICEKIAVVDKCLMDGADEYLQIMDLCAVIMQQICHPLKE